ncbi:MAG: DUF2971 domain-containing protein [Deltaproteobacteria bacterium]|nr:DUF2971 domain-containing protein [Deltaproteobacteria bacterium]
MAGEPQILYKYCSDKSDFHLDALQNNYWYFSHRDDFNDPGDFQMRWNSSNPQFLARFHTNLLMRSFSDIFTRLSGRVLSDHLQLALDERIVTMRWIDVFLRAIDPKISNPFRVIQNHLERVGILCLSERNNSAIMWSHYSNKHKGFCVAYDYGKIREHFGENDSILIADGRVIYSQNLPDPFLIEETGTRTTRRTNDRITSQILTKSLPWAYEEEYRVLKVPRLKDDGKFVEDKERNAQIKVTLPDHSIKTVIFGHRATDSFKNRVRQIAPQGVRFQQAMVFFDRFDHVEIFDLG